MAMLRTGGHDDHWYICIHWGRNGISKRYSVHRPRARPWPTGWGPSQVTIDQKTDLKEPLYFILENTTGTDHEFAVHGLYELVTEQITGSVRSDYFTGPKTATLMRPIHVRVKAKSTLKIAVSDEGLIGERELGAKYRFFCPLHKDAHKGGDIFVD